MRSYLKVLLILWLFPQFLLAVDLNSDTEDFGPVTTLNETTLPTTPEIMYRKFQDHEHNSTDDNINQTFINGTTSDFFSSTQQTELHFTENLINENVTTSKAFKSFKNDDDNKIKDSSMDVSTPNFTTGHKNNHSQLIFEQDSVNGSSGIRYELHFSFNLANNPETTVKSSESVNMPPTNQNKGNLDLFITKRQNKSTLIDNQQDTNVLQIPSTLSSLGLNTNHELFDLSTHNVTSIDTTISASENGMSSNPDSKFHSEIIPETVSTTPANQQTQNSPEQTEANIILIENKTAVIKEDQEYTVTVPKICSNYSVITRLLNLLNVSPNGKRMANLTCENMKNMKVDVKSKELFNNINEILKIIAETDDMVLIKVNPNGTLNFEIDSQSYDGVFFPMIGIKIVGGVVLLIIVIVACFTLYRKYCRQHKTSLDLRMPHLNLKDYPLAPIPRPSVSFSESNRDALHAYASDNYSLSRHNNTLNKRNCSGAVPKTYDAVQEIGCRQEMQTFTMSSGRKSDFKTPPTQDYASAHSWDSLQENNYPKKFGVDNPLFRRW